MAGDIQTMEANNATCFVCDDRLSHAGILLSSGRTASSRTELPTKISQVMGDGFIVVCSTDDRICTRCSTLLNHFDKLETDLAAVQKALTGYLNKKYNLLQIPVSQVEIEEESISIASHNTSEAPDTAVEDILQEDAEENNSIQDFARQEDGMAVTHDEVNSPIQNEVNSSAQNEANVIAQNEANVAAQNRTDASAENEANATLIIAPTVTPKNSNWYKCNNCSFRTTYFRVMTAHKTKCQKLAVHCTMCDERFENQKQLRGHVITQHLTTWPCHFCGLSFTDQTEFTTHVTAHLQSLNNAGVIEPTGPQEEMEDEFIEVVDILGGEDGTNALVNAENSECIEINQNIEVGDEINVVLALEDQQGLESGGEGQELVNVDQWEGGEGGTDKDKLALIWEGLDEVEECDVEKEEQHQCLTCSLTFFNEALLKRHLRTHARNYRPPKPRAERESDGSDEEDLETLIGKMRAREPILPDDVTWPNDEQVELEGSERGSDRMADMDQLIRAKKLSSADVSSNPDLLLDLDPLAAEDETQTQSKPKTGGLACVTCGLELPTARALRAHRLTHPGTAGPHACDACELTFPRERQLAEHVLLMHRDPHCRFCGKEILKAKTLRSHEQRHMRGDQRTFDCTGCERTFKTATGLRHHAAVHTGDYKYCCDFCGRGFMSRMMAEEHRVRHTKEERYVCDICGKKFSFQSTYWIHRKWHDTPMPYKCSFCGRLFKHSSLLAVHRRKHTGERPYKCPHCPLSFPVGGTLKRHLILHTGVYPFTCQSCKRGFTTKHKYLQHLQKAHQVVMEAKPAKTELRMAVREPSADPAVAVNADTLLDWEMADDSTFMLMDGTGGGEMDEIILEDGMIPCHVVSANADDQGQMVQIVMDETPATGDEAGSLIGDLWPTYSVG